MWRFALSRDSGSQWSFQFQRVGEPERLGQFADDAIAWLRMVRPLHPLLHEADFFAGSTNASLPRLSTDPEILKDWVLRYGWDPKADPRVFSETDANGRPTAGATSDVGFRFSLMTPPPAPKLLMRFFAIPGKSLGSRGLGTVELLDAVADPSLLDPGFLRTLIAMTVERYDPDLCSVYSLDFDRAIGHSFRPGPDSKAFLRIGWITYFGNPAVREVLPADIHAEPFGQGLLVMTQPTVPDLSRPEDVERGRRLVGALRKSGWLELSRMKRGVAQ